MNANQNYEREFELKEKEIETRNSIQFQDLLNSLIIQNKQKKNQLQEECQTQDENNSKLLDDISHVLILTEQMQTMKSNLEEKYTLLKQAKQQFQKKSNELREQLGIIKIKPIIVNDDQVMKELHQANKKMIAYQLLQEKFKKNQQKKNEQTKKELENEQEQLKIQEERILYLKQENQHLLDKIKQLTILEQEKKTKLYECYQTSEYVEFFNDVRNLYQDKESPISIQSPRFIKTRSSTRNEIVLMLDEFYNNQNINNLTQEIIHFYQDMVKQLKNQTSQYNQFIEDKAIKTKLLEEVNQELTELINKNNENFLINENYSQQDFPLNSTDIEGPIIQHENYQLSYHVRQNQLNLLDLHLQLKDMVQRISVAIVWLSETSKNVPKNLDNLCTQYLKQYTKLNMKLFIPKNSKSQGKHQKYGSFVSILTRNPKDLSDSIESTDQWIKQLNKTQTNQLPISSSKNITANISTIEKQQFEFGVNSNILKKFKVLKDDYQQIEQCWISILKSDLITYNFVKEIDLNQIEINQPIQDIILQIYILYAQTIKKINYFSFYEIQFQSYKDILSTIIKTKSKLKQQLIYKNQSPINQQDSSSHLSNSFTPNKYIQITYQGQLKRLIENPIEETDQLQIPDNVNKIQKTSDESKFHQYFIQQSSIIQRKAPLLHDQLISQTLQNIDSMRKKELDNNYQTSDSATSENDYLNQERRNLKGILNKKNKQQYQEDYQISELNNQITQRSIHKQVSLLQKISHLTQVNQKFTKVNKQLQKMNQNVQKKLTEYFTQDLTPTEQRIRYPPIGQNSSRSPDTHKTTIEITKRDYSQSMIKTLKNQSFYTNQ